MNKSEGFAKMMLVLLIIIFIELILAGFVLAFMGGKVW